MSICTIMPDSDVEQIYQKTVEKIKRSALARVLDTDQHNLIRVNIDGQRLDVFFGSSLRASYAISSSRYGVGQSNGSLRTPLGVHRINEKFGDNEPQGRVFRARQPQEQIVQVDSISENEDLITSRILWLEGLQCGFNRGGDCDSHDRYIYIHGTHDEAHLGQPASIGCIRMKNSDVVALYEMIEIGDLVVID